MADPSITNVTSGVLNSLINLPGVSTLVKIFQAIGIILAVYFIFLIIRAITQINTSLRFKKLVKNVEEINKKLDILVGNKSGKKDKEDKEEKKKSGK